MRKGGIKKGTHANSVKREEDREREGAGEAERLLFAYLLATQEADDAVDPLL